MARYTIRESPLVQKIANDFPGNYVFTRRGVSVDVVGPDGVSIWERDVWQRGVYLRWRPFYSLRLRHAISKALRVVAAHG